MEKGIEDKLKALTAGKHKEAADVSLPTDVVLSKAAIYAPLGILAITFLYSPELTTEGGVECFHPDTQGFTSMFYVNNFCWESLNNFEHKNSTTLSSIWKPKIQVEELKSIDKTLENFSFHRNFPFVILAILIVGTLPDLVWNLLGIDKKIKFDADFLKCGVEEALEISLRQMVSFVKSNDQIEGDVKISKRLEAHINEINISRSILREQVWVDEGFFFRADFLHSVYFHSQNFLRAIVNKFH